MPVEVGAEFETYEDLDLAVKAYEAENFVNLIIRDTRTVEAAGKRNQRKKYNAAIKYSDISYCCTYGGKKFKSHSTGKRNHKTTKKACPFSLKVRATLDGQRLFVREMCTSHNHEITEEEFRLHPKQRKLDLDSQEDIAKLLGMEPDKKLLREKLMQITGKVILMKDIHNIKTRLVNPKKEVGDEEARGLDEGTEESAGNLENSLPQQQQQHEQQQQHQQQQMVAQQPVEVRIPISNVSTQLQVIHQPPPALPTPVVGVNQANQPLVQVQAVNPGMTIQTSGHCYMNSQPYPPSNVYSINIQSFPSAQVYDMNGQAFHQPGMPQQLQQPQPQPPPPQQQQQPQHDSNSLASSTQTLQQLPPHSAAASQHYQQWTIEDISRPPVAPPVVHQPVYRTVSTLAFPDQQATLPAPLQPSVDPQNIQISSVESLAPLSVTSSNVPSVQPPPNRKRRRRSSVTTSAEKKQKRSAHEADKDSIKKKYFQQATVNLFFNERFKSPSKAVRGSFSNSKFSFASKMSGAVSAQYHDMLKPLSWLFGTWRAEHPGKGIYPTIKDFTYAEEAEFCPVAMKPMVEYKFYSSKPDNSMPLHRETGFIRIKPESNHIAFMAAHNLGVVEVQEGEFKDQQLTVETTSLGRASFNKPPEVKKLRRTLKRTDNELEQVVEMETDKTPMTEHLRITFKKVN